MPYPLRTGLDPETGVLTIAIGTLDTTQGVRIGYKHEFYPRFVITPHGGLLLGDGTAEPTAAGGSGLMTVNHGATAAFARPDTPNPVMWVGSVDPDNLLDGDIVVTTT